MTLIDLNLTDVCEGYQMARQAEEHLLQKWQPQLLDAYEQRLQAYESALEQHQQRRIEIDRQALTGTAVVLGSWFLGVLAFLIAQLAGSSWLALGWLFILAGFGIGGLVLIVWFWRTNLTRPKPPLHPLKIQLVTPILSAWRSFLRGQLPPQSEYGDEGEHYFIRQLQSTLDDSHFIISSMFQRKGEDVDVTVVGPKGVWVFEVKHWNGEVRWQSGHWQREETRFGEPRPVSQPPDEQWRRVAGDVNKTIQMRCSPLAGRYLTRLKAQGGIVFTHPGSTFQIASTMPTDWDRVPDWLKRLRAAPLFPGWQEADTMAILDALLTRHHQIKPATSNRSLKDHVFDLSSRAEGKLAEWVKRSSKLETPVQNN